jgi:uncharacterized protein (TIRG00374 family)
MTRGTGTRRGIQLVGILLSVGAIVILLGSVDVAATVDAVLGADVRLLLLAAALVIVQVVVVTLRWSLLLARVLPGIPARSLLEPVFLGYLGNFVLPARLGEVVRSYVVGRRAGAPVSAVLGSVALERVIDASVLALVASIIAVALDAPTWVIQVSVIATAGGLVILVLLTTPAGVSVGERMARAGSAAVRRVGRSIHRFARAAAPGRRPMIVVAAAALSALSWMLEGTVYLLVARSIEIDVSLSVAFLVAAVTVLSTAVPSAPAYVGTFELAVTAVATAFGVPPADALAWGLLAHAVTVAPLATGGLIALVRTGQRPSALMAAAEAAEGEGGQTGASHPRS